MTANHIASRRHIASVTALGRTRRDRSPVHFGKTKECVFGGDGKIAGDKLSECAAEAVPVHHRDGRLGVVVKLLPTPHLVGFVRTRPFCWLVFEIAEEFLQVLTADKEPPAPVNTRTFARGSNSSSSKISIIS